MDTIQHVANLCLDFDGNKLDKVLQVLFDKNGTPSTRVVLDGQEEMYVLGISKNIAAVVNVFEGDIIENEGMKIESVPMGVVRMCLIKDEDQLIPEHKDFIKSIMANPEEKLKVVVSEAPPEGFEHEYFLKINDEVQYQMRQVIMAGAITSGMMQ